MPTPTNPPQHQRRRDLRDRSQPATLAGVAVTSITTDQPTLSAKVNFSGPVTYAGNVPPQTWSFNGRTPVAYIQRKPTSCRLSFATNVPVGDVVSIAANDPAIRAQAGGYVEAAEVTVGVGPVEVLHVYQDGPNSVYWKFSTLCVSKPGILLSPEGTIGMHIAARTQNISWLDSDELFTHYTTPISIADRWSINPAEIDVEFANGQDLAGSAGQIETHPRDVAVVKVFAQDNDFVSWTNTDQVYTLENGTSGFEVMNDAGVWVQNGDGNQIDDFTMQFIYVGGVLVNKKWRISAQPTGVFYAYQIIVPQNGNIVDES